MTRTRPIGDDGAEAPAPLSSGASAAAGAGRRSPSRRLVVTCSKRQQGHLSGYSEATGPRGLWGRAPGVLGVLGARAGGGGGGGRGRGGGAGARARGGRGGGGGGASGDPPSNPGRRERRLPPVAPSCTQPCMLGVGTGC